MRASESHRIGNQLWVRLALSAAGCFWLGFPADAGSPSENLRLSTAQWREELQFIARELPKRHMNAFHHTPQAQFEATVAALDLALPKLDVAHIYVGLLRLVNSIGDGHTYLRFPIERDDFPVGVSRFGSEYRVVFAAPQFAKAVGTRVIGINGTPIDRVHDLIFAVTPQDETPQYREQLVCNWIATGILLHGLDITPASGAAQFKLVDDRDTEHSVELRSGPKTGLQWAYAKPPLFREHPGEAFWYTWLPQSRTVYCNWRSYEGLARTSRGLFELVDKMRPERLVIDLRQNGGGDYFVGLAYMVSRIRALPEINRKGHVFVLIGPLTFSAAMSNAAHFRQRTAATLVGLPIGEKPNSYQEARSTTLPNSHLTLSYSVRFYKFVEAGENMIRPDREIQTSWDDFKAGRDPVLEYVLKPKP